VYFFVAEVAKNTEQTWKAERVEVATMAKKVITFEDND